MHLQNDKDTSEYYSAHKHHRAVWPDGAAKAC